MKEQDHWYRKVRLSRFSALVDCQMENRLTRNWDKINHFRFKLVLEKLFVAGMRVFSSSGKDKRQHSLVHLSMLMVQKAMVVTYLLTRQLSTISKLSHSLHGIQEKTKDLNHPG